MEIVVAWTGVAPQRVWADWWTPAAVTPLGASVLAVPLAALAVRGRRAADDGRVSMETAMRALAHVVDKYGLLMVSEALRWQGHDYMRERDSISLRAACFPLARQGDAGGHAVAVVPVVMLPLVLARFANTWAPARSPAAVAAFTADLAARLPQTPDADAYRLNYRLLGFVACTDVAQPTPSAADAAASTPATAAPLHVDVLDHETLSALVIEMIMQRRTHTLVSPLHTDASAQPLLAALQHTPYRIEFAD